jgi:hypothetical protein
MLQKVVHITTIGIYRVNTTIKSYKEKGWFNYILRVGSYIHKNAFS